MKPEAESIPAEFAATCGPGQHLEAIFNSVSDGIFALDALQRVTRVNRPALRILGYREDEVLGRPCDEIFSGTLHGESLSRAIANADDLHQERLSVSTKSGERTIIVLSTNLLRDPRGAAAGVVVVFRDVTELETLREEVKGRYRFHNLIGKSGKMQDVFRLVEQAAAAEATVVVEGESGTGKELVARAIHYGSPRAAGPFVPVHCAALAEGILESELFGHVKGAFTGASSDRKGRFETASGGTLFLDEVGEISPGVQLKLLRVIQEREIVRVGSDTTVKIDVRIVAATNKNLRDLIKAGTFREDLYYRLRVVAVTLPPLRERPGDIPLLVTHFIEKYRERTGKAITSCEEAVLRLFLDFPWPGNVRELENAIERAFVVASGRAITLEDIPPEMMEQDVGRAAKSRRDLRSSEPKGEREMILQALTATAWNKAKAARQLGIGRNTLYAKMDKYEIPRSPAIGRA